VAQGSSEQQDGIAAASLYSNCAALRKKPAESFAQGCECGSFDSLPGRHIVRIRVVVFKSARWAFVGGMAGLSAAMLSQVSSTRASRSRTGKRSITRDL
jgi:hypothetical protein